MRPHTRSALLPIALVLLAGCSAPEPHLITATYGDATMSRKVLVAYATRAGSTAEVADSIGRAMAACSAVVDVKPARDVTDISAYQMVVLGSAVHAGQLMPEVKAIVRKHKAALQQKQVAGFVVCLAAKDTTAAARKSAAGYLEPVRKELKLVSEAAFAGRMDYLKLSPLGRFFLKNVIKAPEGDYRNWPAIKAWAEGLCGR